MPRYFFVMLVENHQQQKGASSIIYHTDCPENVDTDLKRIVGKEGQSLLGFWNIPLLPPHDQMMDVLSHDADLRLHSAATFVSAYLKMRQGQLEAALFTACSGLHAAWLEYVQQFAIAVAIRAMNTPS